MDVTSENLDSNYNFLNLKCFGFPCSFVTSNRSQSNYDWRKCILTCLAILSSVISIACLITVLCKVNYLSQDTGSSPGIRELSVALARTKNNVLQNEKLIAGIQTRLDQVYHDPVQAHSPDYNENKIKTVSLGCGGLIPMPREGNSILLDYKSHGQNDNCLWILGSSSKTGQIYPAKIRMSILKQGFNNEENTVVAFDWISWENLASFRLSQSKDYTSGVNSISNMLSFTSSNTEVGTGFTLRLDVIEASEGHLGKSMAFTNSTGTVTHGLDGRKDTVAMVCIINPPLKSFTLTLDQLESKRKEDGSCEDANSLHIIRVGRKGAHAKLPVLCGTVTNRRFFFQEPILVGFEGSPSEPGTGTGTGTGFKMSWKKT